MKEAIEPKNWCDSPYYVREISDLYKIGSRVDAWREFLFSDKIEVLRKLDMSVCSFNQYSMFDNLIIMLDCSEQDAVTGIRSIMLDGVCIYKGHGVSDSQLVEHEAKAKAFKGRMASDTAPYV